MKTITVTKARESLYGLVKNTIQYNDPLEIVAKEGSVVVMSKEDYQATMETIYLSSIPGFKKSLHNVAQDNDWEDWQSVKADLNV